MAERVRISNGEVWLDEATGIVRVNLDPGSTVTLAAAKEQIAAVIKVSQGKRLPLFVDLRSQYTEYEAREYLATEESRAAWCAVALLGSTPVGVAQGKIWSSAHDHPENPARLCFSEPEAIGWLGSFVGKTS